MRHAGSLSILQYNVRKPKDTVMATLLRDPKVMQFDILAIQEPIDELVRSHDAPSSKRPVPPMLPSDER
jgi:hypothetical protein